MSKDSGFEKAPFPEHPNRCQAVSLVKGQCLNLGCRLDDGSYTDNCLAHGGNKQVASKAASSLRNYRLTIGMWRDKLDEKADNANIKSLREEIAILRIMLEERLNQAKTPLDLILQSGPISDLVMKIDRVVTSCHKLDGSMGQLLDKQALLAFASIIIEILTSEIDDETLLTTLGNRILIAVGEAGADG